MAKRAFITTHKSNEWTLKNFLLLSRKEKNSIAEFSFSRMSSLKWPPPRATSFRLLKLPHLSVGCVKWKKKFTEVFFRKCHTAESACDDSPSQPAWPRRRWLRSIRFEYEIKFKRKLIILHNNRVDFLSKRREREATISPNRVSAQKHSDSDSDTRIMSPLCWSSWAYNWILSHHSA